jgi:hypothetical protein
MSIQNNITTLIRFSAASLTLACFVTLSSSANAALQYDQNVTNNTIFGSGNANGSFTTDRADGVELGLRAKLRHNALGAPENTFNSNGDGTYFFQPGVAPTQAFPTAVWSFEWSINSDYDGSSALALDDLTYELSMTSTTGASISTFDPINGVNPGNAMVFWDHSVGTNATGNGAGVEATDATNYASLIAGNNLAQNSWKPHWFAGGFDPTESGIYSFTLSAFSGLNQIASTTMQVNVVPEPATLALVGLGLASFFVVRRRSRG